MKQNEKKLSFTRSGGSRVEDSVAPFFKFLSLSRLICKPQSHVFWAWSRVNAICIDGRVVSTSDSESVGPSSIPGGRKSNFFSFFFFLK